MSATKGETLTPNPNECYSTLTSETRDINLTRRNRYPVQKSGQVENADFSDIADFISPTFINPCFRYSPIANIENLDLKKSEIFKHPCL